MTQNDLIEQIAIAIWEKASPLQEGPWNDALQLWERADDSAKRICRLQAQIVVEAITQNGWTIQPPKLQAFLRFTECETCAAKTGSPQLCAGCLHNRNVISAYNQASLKGDPKIATQLGDAGRTKTWLRARKILNTPITR